MRRYAETFFRYWLIALVPLIVLPLADYAIMRKAPKTVLASANIWVNQSLAGSAANYDSYLSPAQLEAGTLNQLLQSPSFDLTVVRGSSLYTQLLLKVPLITRIDFVVTDLLKNVQIVPKGDNLLNVSYTSQNWQLGLQVVQSLLDTARNQGQALNQLQTKAAIAYYTYQLHSARDRLAQSSQKLSDYMKANAISPSQLATQQAVDPTLATLYQQNQSDQTDVTAAQQKLSQLLAQSTVPSSIAEQAAFQVQDEPNVSIVSSTKAKIMNLAIALVLGLLLGGGFVVAKTALDRSLRYADEVPALLGLPVLVVVPYSSALVGQHKGASPAISQVPQRDRLARVERSG